MRLGNIIARLFLFGVVVTAGIAAGWFLFIELPQSGLELAGIVFLLLLIPMLLRAAGGVAGSVAPRYNVAEVAVTGPITRQSSGGGIGTAPSSAGADEIVEQIDRANQDSSAQALLVRLNTPGGEIVPSEDIKLAAERFEGPTIAYATDTCASGGYEIASGCDEIWAREGSIVGSIGVIGSRVTAADLAEKLGLEYEQLTAGEYKDAGVPLKDLDEDERAYLQGLIDDFYDQFVANVAERRGMDPAEIEETEARVYLGSEAAENGLVDELGTRTEIEDELEQQLGQEVVIREFEPDHGIAKRLNLGAQRCAYAFGAGITGSVLDDNQQFEFR